MANKSIKRIWLVCLCLVSLSLTWCFHVPDEDWLPSKSKTETSKSKEDAQVEEALNSFMDWLDMVSSQRDEIKNDETTTELENELTENESTDPEIEDNIIYEE